jgi:hypothetical protein
MKIKIIFILLFAFALECFIAIFSLLWGGWGFIIAHIPGILSISYIENIFKLHLNDFFKYLIMIITNIFCISIPISILFLAKDFIEKAKKR